MRRFGAKTPHQAAVEGKSMDNNQLITISKSVFILQEESDQ